MKFNNILFDYGDTLYSSEHNCIQPWTADLIDTLYQFSYRLGIISNTHRYQDAYWVRRRLAEAGMLDKFEMVISSAIYGYHKPDQRIFQKAVDFMEIDPRKTIMIGDSEYCDSGSTALGMTYLRVIPDEKWGDRLWKLLHDSTNPTRKLTRLSEYWLRHDTVFVQLRHMSEVVQLGDTILLHDKEYVVLGVSRAYTKEETLGRDAGDKFLEIKVKKV